MDSNCDVCGRERVGVLENAEPTDRCWNHIGQDYHCFRLGYERQRAEVTRLRDALGALFGFFESGDLVRCTARDAEPGFAIRSMKLVMALKHAHELVAPRTTADEHAAASAYDGGEID